MYVYVRYLEVVHGLKLVKHIFAGLRQCELDGRIEELLQFHIKNICPSNITNPMVAWWLRICSPQLYTTGLFQPALQDLFTKGLGCYVHHSGVNRQVPPLYHRIIPSSLAAIDVLIGVIRFSSFGLVGSDM